MKGLFNKIVEVNLNDRSHQTIKIADEVYENYLGDLDNAKMIYLEFLEKYPDNEFADDAEISIQNLGKSPEELIRQFEEQQAQNDPE